MNKTYKWFDYRLFLNKWFKEQLKKIKVKMGLEERTGNERKY
jgi:hypothetical protein